MFSDKGSSSGEVKMVENVNSGTFSQLIQDNNDAVIIDVRTPMEFNHGHIPNALLIDISSPSFVNEIELLDKSKTYLLYCRSGNRSFYAGKEMINRGFEKVYNLVNGILGWYEPLIK